MTYQHYINKEFDCVFMQHTGEIGLDDILEQTIEMTSLPDFKSGMNILRDISQTKLPSGYDVERMTKDFKTPENPIDNTLGTNRMVAWVVGNPHDFKIIHQFCALHRLNKFVTNRQPFRDIGRAKKWLDIPEDYEIVFPDA